MEGLYGARVCDPECRPEGEKQLGPRPMIGNHLTNYKEQNEG